MPCRPNSKVKRIPSLDGLRAVSISLVLYSHSLGLNGFLPSGYAVSWTGDLGNLGVRVFFVISGYLISTLLLLEHAKKGNVSLFAFYWRRAFRILPPSYLFLCILLAVRMINSTDALAGFTYSVNYPLWPPLTFSITHLWSLSVEEQFYLLWPSVMKFFGINRAMALAASFVILSPAIRLAALLFAPHAYIPYIGNTFETTADAIACGCVLAGLNNRLVNNQRYRGFLESKWMYVMPPAILIFNSLSHHPRFAYLVGYSVMNIFIALSIHSFVLAPRGFVGRLLNSSLAVWIGTLSYSIYLWQQIFLDPRGRWVLNQFPFNIAAILMTACASYYLVERPAFWLRDHLRPRALRTG